MHCTPSGRSGNPASGPACSTWTARLGGGVSCIQPFLRCRGMSACLCSGSSAATCARGGQACNSCRSGQTATCVPPAAGAAGWGMQLRRCPPIPLVWPAQHRAVHQLLDCKQDVKRSTHTACIGSYWQCALRDTGGLVWSYLPSGNQQQIKQHYLVAGRAMFMAAMTTSFWVHFRLAQGAGQCTM